MSTLPVDLLTARPCGEAVWITTAICQGPTAIQGRAFLGSHRKARVAYLRGAVIECLTP